LRNFEEIGLVKSDWDSEETQGPPRRVYVLTEEGLATLKRAEKSLNETRQKIDSLLTIISEEK
jgi:DNA-binding PadR family transcriptional regulator